MRLSGIFSKRNVMLLVFILVVLFLGTAFNVKIGHESFVEGATNRKEEEAKAKAEAEASNRKAEAREKASNQKEEKKDKKNDQERDLKRHQIIANYIRNQNLNSENIIKYMTETRTKSVMINDASNEANKNDIKPENTGNWIKDWVNRKIN